MKKRCAFFLQSYFLVCVAWMSGVLADKPPEEMPEALRSAFTFDGKILEDKWYWDGTVSSSAPIRYTKGEMQMYLGYAAKRLTLYYGETDPHSTVYHLAFCPATRKLVLVSGTGYVMVLTPPAELWGEADKTKGVRDDTLPLL